MTDQILRLIILVAIGGLIGYLTNKLAIKMLFRPVNPVKFLGFTIQGVFPRRKDKIAKSLAEIIQRDLLSQDVLMDELLNEDNKASIKEMIKDQLVEALSESIPPMFKMFLGENPKATIANLIESKGDTIFNSLFDAIKEKGLGTVDIEGIVKRKIDELDFIEFEQILLGLMKQELQFVEVVGFFLGALIGALQFVVTLFI